MNFISLLENCLMENLKLKAFHHHIEVIWGISSEKESSDAATEQ